MVQLGPQRICQARTLAPERVCHQHIGRGMDGLHRGDDIHLAEAIRIVRMDHLHMFNAMPEGGTVTFVLKLA